MSITLTDLVIAGAGAAGLAAARSARERSVDTILLEASGRIGGRAWTDMSTFGIPWDRGCHWLHSADIDPMMEHADRNGFTYRQEPSHWRLIEDGKFLDDFALDSVEQEVEAMYAATFQNGRGGEDRAVSHIAVLRSSQPSISDLHTEHSSGMGI